MKPAWNILVWLNNFPAAMPAPPRRCRRMQLEELFKGIWTSERLVVKLPGVMLGSGPINANQSSANKLFRYMFTSRFTTVLSEALYLTIDTA